ncbi:hypothetical protein [Immundisolibacter sp.]
MATTTVTPVQIVKNVASANLPITGGTAIVAANDHAIAFPQEGKLHLILNNTYAGSKNFTIKAGSSSYVASGVGDLVIALAQNDVKHLELSSDRFKNSDGNVIIQVESATTGYIQAFYTS